MPRFEPNELAAWLGARWGREPSAPITSVSVDSRTLAPGALYLALRGDRFDGHDFVASAYAAGAAAVLVETGRAPAGDGSWLEVADTRRGLVDLARRYRSGLQATVVGITGSAGKTTVKELLAGMLAKIGSTARTHQNWNNDIGLPLSLLRTERADQFGVFEIGTNHPGEIAALSEILRPEVAVVTTVGSAHLEFFGTEAAIAREKSMLPASLPSKGWVVLDADDAWFDTLAGAAPCRVVSVSQHPTADYVWKPSPDHGGWDVLETKTGDRVLFNGAIVGEFFRLDATLAIGAARQLGIGWPLLQEAVAAYEPPSMRWEATSSGGVVFINDGYNANPISMRAALEAFAEHPVAGRRWLVLGAMRELGPDSTALHREVGRSVGAGDWAGLVAYGSWGEPIAEGARAAGLPESRLRLCDSPEQAVKALRGWVRTGDAVLLKASRSERLEEVLTQWVASTAARVEAEPALPDT